MGILSDRWADSGLGSVVLAPAPVSTVVAEQRAAQTAAAQAVLTPTDLPLISFVRDAWPMVEKGRKYDDNWHLDAIAEHAQAVFTGEITHLLINAPPRSGKSLIISVMLHPWSWILNPAFRWLFFSYSMTLSLRDARRARELIRSPWYQQRWGDRVQIDPAFDTIVRLRTTAGGQRFSSTIGGMATGEGADCTCLPAGERVLTELGWLPIDDIVEQQLPVRIAAFDHAHGCLSWQPILRYFRREIAGEGHSSAVSLPAQTVYTLRTTAGATVRLTGAHPVYVVGRGYVGACTVRAGEKVLSAPVGEATLPDLLSVATVESVVSVVPASIVYNLMVAQHYNYFAEGILLHNCIDDPHNADEDRRESRTDIEAAKDFIQNTLASRVENFNEARQIVNGQRIAVDDISADIRSQHTHEELILPMRYVPPPDDEAPPVSAIGWSDPRTVPGELLWPAHMNDRVATTMARTKPRIWAAHFQQAPEDATDKLFPRGNWRYFDRWPDVEYFSILMQSWDMRFTDDPSSGSYVAGHIWGKHGPNLYLLERVFDRLSFTATQAKVLWMTNDTRYGPHTTAKLVENKANGPAIMQSLRATVAGFIPVEPRLYGGKYDRAQAMAFLPQAGNIYLPHKDLAPWVEDYVTNMFRFPAPPDDDTDASTQAWRRLHPLKAAEDPTLHERQERQQWERRKQQALRQQRGRLRLSRTNA